jgi:hypothetical protein
MTDWSAILARAFDKRLETGGDGGDIGDKFPKALEALANRRAGIVTNQNPQVVTVVTRPAAVTTVTTASTERGDKGSSPILARFQAHRRSVTSVTTVTTDLDLRARFAVDRLRSMAPPESFDPAKWHQLLIDADRFIQRWWDRAELSGWSDKELFGVHPRAPTARFDAMGLILLIRGGEVVDLDEKCARISTVGRSLMSCSKPRYTDAVPVWTLTDSFSQPLMSAFRVPAQPVDATQALNLSAGVSNCKVSRGRSFKPK